MLWLNESTIGWARLDFRPASGNLLTCELRLENLSAIHLLLS
jgi:hypothetical protein